MVKWLPWQLARFNLLHTKFCLQITALESSFLQVLHNMIKLTRPERRLRDVLVSAANAWPRRPDQTESLIVRFAGGWVRDKLLAKENDDIDVALNIPTGVQFASHVENYLHTNPLDPPEPFKLVTIGQNIEQSKHLETS